MQKIWKKIILAVLIVVVVTLLSIITGEKWVLLLYTTILALFPDKIKAFLDGSFFYKQVRISYAYLFRIQIDGLYLLVKDEQGRDNYHPVGGVYKYYQDKVDVADEFEGQYDGIFDSSKDTRDDLRLKIRRNKLKKFHNWFCSSVNRESIADLSREFVEELLDTNILPWEVFTNLQYKYVGSCSQKGFNDRLNLPQIRHFDIFNIKLTGQQKMCLSDIKSNITDLYVFATEQNIEDGSINFGGKTYHIAESAKLILIKNASTLLKKEIVSNSSYSIPISKT